MNNQQIQVEKLCYLQDWPDEALEAVRAVLDPLDWLVPGWCNEVCVRWQGAEKKQTCISCSIEYDYRRVNLWFYASFLDQDEAERHYEVIHDLLHGFSCVLADFCESTIKELLPTDEAQKFRNVVNRELTMRHEQWTQDLAWCLHQRLKSPDVKEGMKS